MRAISLSLKFILLCLILDSCHPMYKRLTRGKWYKDTLWVKYPDLPKPIFDTLEKYYIASLTPDKSDDLKDGISLDPSQPFIDVEYNDLYSKKFKIPFGWFFKIGKRKYFIHYSELRTPIVYYNNALYFISGEYFDPTIKHRLYSEGERWPYDKMYFVKLKLK